MLFLGLRERIGKIYRFRRVLWDLSIKQLKAKYAGSLLGVSWSVINPLLIMSAITFVFTAVFKTQIKGFSFFALAGILPWMFFSNALTEAAFSLVNQQSLLRQFNLPREIFPLSSIMSNFINFLIGWLVIYPLLLFFNQKIILFFPWLIAILLFNLFFIFGLGLAFSVLNVFFRDLGHLLGVLLMFWFWMTPVFYSLDMIPSCFRWLYNFNPMVPFIIYYREVTFYAAVPSVYLIVSVFIWTFISLFLGLLVFARYEPKLLKQI